MGYDGELSKAQQQNGQHDYDIFVSSTSSLFNRTHPYVCHTNELVSNEYEISPYLCHADELVT